MKEQIDPEFFKKDYENYLETDRGAHEKNLGEVYTKYVHANDTEKLELVDDLNSIIATMMETEKISYGKALELLKKVPSEDHFYNYHMLGYVMLFLQQKFEKEEQSVSEQKEELINFLTEAGEIGEGKLWEVADSRRLRDIVEVLKKDQEVLQKFLEICPKAQSLVRNSAN